MGSGKLSTFVFEGKETGGGGGGGGGQIKCYTPP